MNVTTGSIDRPSTKTVYIHDFRTALVEGACGSTKRRTDWQRTTKILSTSRYKTGSSLRIISLAPPFANMFSLLTPNNYVVYVYGHATVFIDGDVYTVEELYNSAK